MRELVWRRGAGGGRPRRGRLRDRSARDNALASSRGEWYKRAVAELSSKAVVGRQEELARLAGFLSPAEDRPHALVLDGEAGIGKTTLFEAALADARDRGFAVFSCRPAGAETAFSFVALADLLEPVLPHGLDRLPLPQRRRSLRARGSARVAVPTCRPPGCPATTADKVGRGEA